MEVLSYHGVEQLHVLLDCLGFFAESLEHLILSLRYLRLAKLCDEPLLDQRVVVELLGEVPVQVGAFLRLKHRVALLGHELDVRGEANLHS